MGAFLWYNKLYSESYNVINTFRMLDFVQMFYYIINIIITVLYSSCHIGSSKSSMELLSIKPTTYR